jgi:hypothetical protein
MCAPQLLQLRWECGFKTVKMRKLDLMESMILQLYDQIPIQASAPEHAEAKGHNCAQLEPMAGNSISNPTSTGNTTQDMERCQESEMGNTHGMNEDFMKTNSRLYVQGQPGLPVAKYTHRSKREVDIPCSLAPLPISDNKTVSSGNLLNKTDLHRSIPTNPEAEGIQGRGGSSKLRKQDVSIRRPNNANICTTT